MLLPLESQFQRSPPICLSLYSAELGPAHPPRVPLSPPSLPACTPDTLTWVYRTPLLMASPTSAFIFFLVSLWFQLSSSFISPIISSHSSPPSASLKNSLFPRTGPYSSTTPAHHFRYFPTFSRTPAPAILSRRGIPRIFWPPTFLFSFLPRTPHGPSCASCYYSLIFSAPSCPSRTALLPSQLYRVSIYSGRSDTI